MYAHRLFTFPFPFLCAARRRRRRRHLHKGMGCSGLMDSALDSGMNRLVLSPGWVLVLCSWARHLRSFPEIGELKIDFHSKFSYWLFTLRELKF